MCQPIKVEVVRDLGVSVALSVKTHLAGAHRLGPPGGDLMGYDLETRVLSDATLDALDHQVPACVLVRRARPVKAFKVSRLRG